MDEGTDFRSRDRGFEFRRSIVNEDILLEVNELKILVNEQNLRIFRTTKWISSSPLLGIKGIEHSLEQHTYY